MCLKQKHLFPFPHGSVAQEACIVARSHCKNGYNRKDRLFGQSNVSLQRSSRWKKCFFFVNDVDVSKNSNNGLLHDDCTYLCIGLIVWCMFFLFVISEYVHICSYCAFIFISIKYLYILIYTDIYIILFFRDDQCHEICQICQPKKTHQISGISCWTLRFGSLAPKLEGRFGHHKPLIVEIMLQFLVGVPCLELALTYPNPPPKKNTFEKMIFLFPRWDMWSFPGRVAMSILNIS